MRKHRDESGWGYGFPPHPFHCGRGWGAHWVFGFPRRGDYVEMLEAYRQELQDAQREIAEELEDVTREIEALKRGTGDTHA